MVIGIFGINIFEKLINKRKVTFNHGIHFRPYLKKVWKHTSVCVSFERIILTT